MSLREWNTKRPLDPGFEKAWRERLAAIPHAHFALDPAYLANEARHGHHVTAVLIDEGGKRGALVLRESKTEVVSGWPWRWQAMVENGGGPPRVGLSSEDAEWLWDHAQRLSSGLRLRFHVPVPALNGTPSFPAGITFFQSLDRSEDELWKALDGAKRRMTKRARGLGYQVVEARDLELLRAFENLPRDASRRQPRSDTSRVPEPGEGWREWEQPWMWLLLAVKDGVVEAGSGFGLSPGSSIDYRTNASSPAGKKDGANVLLAWEAMRLGRERGYRWLNWGGATRFKQEFGGERVDINCRLGGGAVWLVPNIVDASAHHARMGIGRWKRRRAQAAAAAATERKAAPAARSEKGQLVGTWSTRQPLDAEFEKSWSQMLSKAPLANFAFDTRYLSWEARHGQHAMAVLIEHQGRRGALVLRETGGGWVCGWPWRWVAAMVEPKDLRSPGLAPEDATLLFRLAEQAVRGARLRCFLPVAPPADIAAYEAGATIIQSLDRTDEEMVAAMHGSKRRMLRRAQQEGYDVVEGRTLDQFRQFAMIQVETFLRRGIRVHRDLADLPEAGEDWREWEHPWMWLLLAEREGRVESGLGDGVSSGGTLEGRTGASTAAGRRAGAFALLCHEEARRGRDRGFHWLNHGGDTPFKREIAGACGTRLAMHCWLGGDSRWVLPNRSEAWARHVRSRVPALLRAWRASRKETS